MRTDIFLFGGILLFIFVLWVYSGGPQHPISFAGPYLTPITNVDHPLTDSSSINSLPTTGSGGYTYGSYGNTSDIPAANRSTLAGSVRISSGTMGGGSADKEYIFLQSNSNSSVDITGWQVVSVNSGVHMTIPQATAIVHRNGGGVLDDVILTNGGQAIVSSGSSPFLQSFLETACTGYLAPYDTFNPSLDTGRCPSPQSDLSSFYGVGATRYNDCVNYVSSIGRCQLPGVVPGGLPSGCQNFVNNSLNYEGCVQAHDNDNNFKGTTWRLYLYQNRPIWRLSGDTLQLLDRTGKIVDQYSY